MTSAGISRAWWLGIGLLLVAMIVLAAGAVAWRATQGGDGRPALPVPRASSGVETLKAGTHRRQIVVEGRQRTYLVHVPAGRRNDPSAAVLVFHGAGGNAENAVRMSRFDRAAEEHGFIAVFPDGIGRQGEQFLTFNSGNCCGFARDEGIDDVAFTRALIQDLSTAVAIDYQRLYVTGMSNGGMMAYRLACEAADLFAAAAPVAGANNLDACKPSRPVALLVVHGTADTSVKFEGGRSDPAARLDTHDRIDRGVAESILPFLDMAKCTTAPTVSRSGESERHVYPCKAGAVEVLAVIDGGHAWPGGERGPLAGDPPSKPVDATAAIWAFFKEHPRK